ncbi:DUF3017 domain-containing protein [Microlunatus sp. Gsoil 973]|jgi:hypothetical protein|uniref:DUF3017 domain-containing protein n=1 Tax=Microlunatus sp. Gsoil 973 TaxID=2672569 RepID=UPI0012B451D3|nr:DUF3017 domain-containing protein [Microlunatus sp. Gsoil 973]QGN35163.1 DUF3017 domain-containing protein [Microlunatus sp. Gsoil 973]
MEAERRRVPPTTPAEVAPLAVVVGGMLAGVVVVVLGHWRFGSMIIGVFLTAGGVARLALNDRAGLLRARNRFFDVIALLGMGIAIIVLAIVVPNGTPAP